VDTAVTDAEKISPQIILINASLIKGSCAEIEESLRSTLYTANIPVLFYNVSGNSGSNPGKNARVDYLGDTFTDRELLKKIVHLTAVAMDSTTVTLSVKKTAFSGSISGTNLLDLVQYFEISRKTGVLKITSQKGAAEICILEGQITHAAFGPETGNQAVENILMWEEGEFAFTETLFKKDKNVNKPTLQILLDITKKRDENVKNNGN
jgi:hypothetical protein